MKIIRHQLWNQRRQNGWIFVELVVVSFFLWTVIDPIYVLGADNRPVSDDENTFGNKAGKHPATIPHHAPAVRPISSGKLSGLLYKRWVKAREAEVQRLSNGRLGYVHIPSMGDDEFRTVYSEVMGKYYQCDGIVIDIRYNGGGRLHEDLETFFSGKAYLQQEVRGQDYCTMPSKRWTKPSVMLVCEADYSNAHGSPWVYQTLGMGKVVGMPVPGTMTSVNWVTMQNPLLFFGIPAVGYRTQQGDFLENKQLEPDVVVPLDYNRVLEGHDSQLEAAVRVLLEEVKAHPQPTFPKR